MPKPPSYGSPKRVSRYRRLLAAAGVPVLGSAALLPLAAAPAAASASSPAAAIDWRPCPRYSDPVLTALGVRGGQIPRFRRLMARMRCGTLRVPLRYDRPDGATIAIAVTRLPATDPAHRLGDLAVNPGGPGDSGYLMPIRLVMQNPTTARLNERYDLIGFDPRGVGYSTRFTCPELAHEPAAPTGPPTEQTARRAYAQQVTANRECAERAPAFLSQLTTANVARDLDRIRAALGAGTISYLGTSWGTGLGANYRSLFPGRVSRMWLDSVMGPDYRLDAYADATAEAAERDFSRQAAWIARRNAIYRLGTSPAAVRTAVLRLEHAYDAHPKKYADAVVDGRMISGLAARTSGGWGPAAQALTAMTHTPGLARSSAADLAFAGPDSAPPSGAPEKFDPTMNRATICNEEAGRRDFASAWAGYRRRLARYPVTGRNGDFVPMCAGWPFPVRPWRLRPGGGALEMSGHRYEVTTPYAWTLRMQAAIGGTVLTVDDDVHASAVRVPGCTAHIVAFFDTGRPDAGECAGAPEPSSHEPDAAGEPGRAPHERHHAGRSTRPHRPDRPGRRTNRPARTVPNLAGENRDAV